ncbi:MAG: HAD-IA family hydrolase [Chloroflexi bacterium]|nr:HAD-IA family hydrolase [Chloroflexota bacterium]
MDRIRSGLAGLLFDFDGTLVHQTIDFEAMLAEVLAIAAEYGIDKRYLGGRYVLEMIEAAAPSLGERGAEFAHASRRAIEALEVRAAETAQPFAGVAKMLAELRARGYRIAIITRNCLAAVQAVLERHPLTYDALLTREDVPAVKPAPGHLYAALDALNVTARQSLMAGDHPMDILGGQRVGALTVGITPENGDAGHYASAPPDLMLTDITELAGWLPERAAPVEPRRIETIDVSTLAGDACRLTSSQLCLERWDGQLTPQTRHCLLESSDSAAVVPYDAFSSRVVLIKRFRPAPLAQGDDAWLWEAISGHIEPGVTPKECTRAASDQAGGYPLGELELVSSAYTSPGMHSERAWIYVAPIAVGARHSKDGGSDAKDKDILVRLFLLDDALRMVAEGQIRDAKTVVALLHIALHRARLIRDRGR